MKLLLKLTSVIFVGIQGAYTGRDFYLNPAHIKQAHVRDDRCDPYTEIVLTNSDRVWCLETPEQINKLASK